MIKAATVNDTTVRPPQPPGTPEAEVPTSTVTSSSLSVGENEHAASVSITTTPNGTADGGITTGDTLPLQPGMDENRAGSAYLRKDCDDIFAPREGKQLVWRNVNMILTEKNNHGELTERRLLDNVWGSVPPRQTSAIMGPSGAGKTSLLNVLAGRVTASRNINISADIRVDGVRVKPAENLQVRQMIAFVEQSDSLNVASTPRESIRFSAKLRLPKTTTDEQINRLTEGMLAELGLTDCANTLIGGRLLKGISGGERKRTAVAVELVVKPALIFLDEPTSGLDSFSAVQICEVLKKVANSGATVLFTIHQPSSSTFSSFDRVILMKKGRILHEGPVEKVPSDFAARGFPIPEHFNPADSIMDVAQAYSITDLEQAGFYPQDERKLQDMPDEVRRFSWRAPEGPDPKQVGMGVQLQLLMQREFLNIRRNKAAMKARFGLTCFMSTLIGLIFLNVGSTDLSEEGNLQSAFGGLMMASLTNIFSTALPSLIQFPEERPVFIREFSTNHYSVLTYFTSRLCVEALLTGGQALISCTLTYTMIDFNQPFGIYFISIYILAMGSTAMAVMIGSAVRDPSTAFEFMPPLFVPQILFSGFFVRTDLIPVWLRWLRNCFALTFTIRILLIQEFDGRCRESPITGVNGCEALLEDVDANPDEVWWYWLILGGLFVFFRVVALLTLRAKAREYY